MPPQLPPESHYDPDKLGKIFAFVAVVLLLSLIGLFAKDYSRQWKDYQRQYRGLEVEKARVKLDAEGNDLNKNEEYKKLLQDLSEAQKKINAKAATVKELKAKVHAAQVINKLHTQQSQFAKAQYGALRYKYETAANTGAGNAQDLKIQLDTLAARIEELRLKIEADVLQEKTSADVLKDIEKEYKNLDKKRMALAKKQDILERKLKKIDIAEMSLANQLAEMVRDLPLLDLANPNDKINQIVVKDIPEDVNFMKVPRVDRCTTCHLGIANPDFKDAAQPFRAHPNLEMFVDKNSPHPMDQFACTTCHMGRGRATDFISAAHTPRDEEQKKDWEQKYGWRELEHWEHPMLPAGLTQASCLKCHGAQEVVKGAEKLNFGLALVERAGCYGCHAINKYKDWPKTGPTLEFVASKTTKEWAYHWIEDPKSIRPDAWMPSYFNQSNNNDPASVQRSEQEIHAMVAFLFANSKPFAVEPAALGGDAKKGKELVASIGCLACHQIESNKKDTPRTRDSLHREFGPNLIGLGSKTSQAWLYDWLKDPNRYHGETRMPNLRLGDQEAADIAAYLVQDISPVAGKPVPPVNEKVLDVIVMDFLVKNESVADARAKLNAMDRDAKMVFAGRRLIREYGCYSCHKIPGFENEKPIGTDLSEEGSKSIERLDFGFARIEHTRQAWFEQKLLEPRIFDKGRVLGPLERTKMPNFNFTPQEAEAITAVLLGMVKDRPEAAKMPNQGVKAAFIDGGQKTVRQLNCQACHTIEGEGGTIQSTVIDWLVADQGRDANDAKAIVRSFSPPNLVGEGQKVQAQWLFEFLHGPTPIRPWLHVRMPTYGFHGGQLNSLVKYFNYLDDQEFPFTDIYHPDLTKEEFAAAEKLFSKEVFGCAQCHIVGKQMPGGSPDNWAPDFGLAAKRLKPEWIIKWIANPADLLPGTKMPTYYDPKDFEHSGPPDILNGDTRRQIKALRDYLLTISANPDMAGSSSK